MGRQITVLILLFSQLAWADATSSMAPFINPVAARTLASGRIAIYQRKFDEAKSALDQAVAAYRRNGTSANYAAMTTAQRNFDSAKKRLEQERKQFASNDQNIRTNQNAIASRQDGLSPQQRMMVVGVGAALMGGMVGMAIGSASSNPPSSGVTASIQASQLQNAVAAQTNAQADRFAQLNRAMDGAIARRQQTASVPAPAFVAPVTVTAPPPVNSQIVQLSSVYVH